MGGLRIHASVKSDSAKAKAKLEQIAKMDVAKKVIKAAGSQLQKSTMRNMGQKYTGHMEGNKHVMPTGTTKRSVALHIEDQGLTSRVTVGTEYFPYLELGTRYMAARPTLKPAFKEATKMAQDRLHKLERG